MCVYSFVLQWPADLPLEVENAKIAKIKKIYPRFNVLWRFVLGKDIYTVCKALFQRSLDCRHGDLQALDDGGPRRAGGLHVLTVFFLCYWCVTKMCNVNVGLRCPAGRSADVNLIALSGCRTDF